MPAKWMQDALAAQEAEAGGKKTNKGKGAREKIAKKVSLELAKTEVQKIEADGPLVRLIFPCTKGLADRITAEWHHRKLGSKSETIRVLLEKALAK